MALRIGQPAATSYPAVLPEEELPLEAPVEDIPEMPAMGQSTPMDGGSVVEWLQEAMDLCNQYQCPEDLAYAIEQALVHLIGPSAVGATEPAMEAPIEEPVTEEPVEEEEEAE